MKHLDKIYKDSDIAWFTPVELFKVKIISSPCLIPLILIHIIGFRFGLRFFL